jgi:DNA-directed RNA polymerase subunit RPC12/RpoP
VNAENLSNVSRDGVYAGGMAHAKTSYVCLPCRASYKQPYDRERQRVCPRCSKHLIHVGSAFAAPRRRNTAAWRTLSVLVNAGVGFHKSCCGGPGYRPRTRREVRERMAHARRTGEPIAKALLRYAP